MSKTEQDTYGFIKLYFPEAKEDPILKASSSCVAAIQWLACMQFIVMYAGCWISNRTGAIRS